jgi:hypothetical protein
MSACSAPQNEIIDNSVIFKSSDKLVCLASNLFEIPRLYGLRTDFAYDGITGSSWLHVVKNTVSEFHLLKDDGSTAKIISIVYNDAKYVTPSTGGGFFVNNNIALISTKGEEYRTCLLVNLSTCAYKKYYIENLKFEVIMGFTGESVFGNNWSYNFETGVLTNLPDNIHYYRHIPSINRLIGLTPEGLVVLYDYVFTKYESLNITRKIYLYSGRFVFFR